MGNMTSHPHLPPRDIVDGPIPKHAQLRDILDEVCRTTLKPGDLLPGERLLEETYGVSRITVRRAIGDLVARWSPGCTWRLFPTRWAPRT